MKQGYRTGLILLCAFMASCTHTRYLARDFFEDAGLECISAVEPIRQEEKESLIESGFAISGERDSPFSIISSEPDRLRLRDVDIHVHTVVDGGWVVSVTSILGNHGQSQHTAFYGIDGTGRITGELTPESLGIGTVLTNEFLDGADHFPEGENSPVPIFILDDGTIQASPWTWMNPDWEYRESVNAISFVWNGRMFEKVVVRVVD